MATAFRNFILTTAEKLNTHKFIKFVHTNSRTVTYNCVSVF
jgi:hypothetical protein